MSHDNCDQKFDSEATDVRNGRTAFAARSETLYLPKVHRVFLPSEILTSKNSHHKTSVSDIEKSRIIFYFRKCNFAVAVKSVEAITKRPLRSLSFSNSLYCQPSEVDHPNISCCRVHKPLTSDM